MGFNAKNAKENEQMRINKYLHKITYKISSFSNIRSHTITIEELNYILTFILKHITIIECKWKNYYYYYFKNVCYILILIKNSHTFPNNINYIPSYISISIYHSLNIQPNITNNNFLLKSNNLLDKIYVFLNSLH